MKMYTAPGQLVIDPFSGIGTTGYVSVEQGRDYIGIELKESFHKMSIDNCNKAQQKYGEQQHEKQMGLFD